MTMENSVKKFIAYFLIGLTLFFTAIAILGIWEIIDLEDIFNKIFFTLLVIFAAAAVVLFVFTVLIRSDDHRLPEKE